MNRRAFGLTAVFLVANSTFAATATACLMTGDGAVHAPSTAASAGTHHQHHAASPVSDDSWSDVPAGTPNHKQSVPTCCKPLAPCTSLVSAGTVVTVPSAAELGMSIASGEFAPPASRVARHLGSG